MHAYQFSSIRTSKMNCTYMHNQKSVSEAKRPQEIIYAVNNWWPKGQVYMYPQSLTSTPTGCTEVYK